MKQHILLTKLQRPPVAPDNLHWDRLLDRLNEGRPRTLSLISAPAGYGKSTLASQWAAACDCPSAWVSLDESDGETRMFLSYLLAAVKSLFPGTTFRTEALLEAAHLPPAADLARHLLNDLQQVPAPFILVLDDFHCIADTPACDLAAALLDYPPRAMHLALVTRRDPALPLANLRCRGQLTEIRAADLRFIPGEAGAFLAGMLSVPVDDATVEMLDAKIEGWATGLRLAGLYLRDRADWKEKVR
jgi:LuxR family maltose regulon positive regulatory protein